MYDAADERFRNYMRALGRKGGAATKRTLSFDPTFYVRIGKKGGQASADARRRKCAEEVDAAAPALGQRADSPSVPGANINATARVNKRERAQSVLDRLYAQQAKEA